MRLGSINKLILFSLLVFVGVFNASCGGGEMASSSFSSPSTGDDDDDDGIGAGSPTGFFVQSKAADWPISTLLHKFYDRSAPCVVTPSATGSDRFIDCMLNVQEADLHLGNSKFEINVPSGMCKYLEELPYSFWNDRAGVGPGTLAVTVDETATPVAITSCTVNGNAGSVIMSGARCSFPTEPGGTGSEGYFKVDGTPVCVYDYKTPTARNCCAGRYVLTTTKITTDGTVVEEPAAADWGGKIGNCIEGPGMSKDWIQDSKNSIPLTKPTYAAEGLSKTYTIPSGLSFTLSATSIFVSNFYGWTQYAAGNHPAATAPFPLRYSTDYSGTSLSGMTNPYYQYICRGPADEIRARIRVHINEWDTRENYTAYIGGDNSVSPDSTGTVGSGCTADGLPGEACNDYEEWDLGNYTNSFPQYIDTEDY